MVRAIPAPSRSLVATAIAVSSASAAPRPQGGPPTGIDPARALPRHVAAREHVTGTRWRRRGVAPQKCHRRQATVSAWVADATLKCTPPSCTGCSGHRGRTAVGCNGSDRLAAQPGRVCRGCSWNRRRGDVACRGCKSRVDLRPVPCGGCSRHPEREEHRCKPCKRPGRRQGRGLQPLQPVPQRRRGPSEPRLPLRRPGRASGEGTPALRLAEPASSGGARAGRGWRRRRQPPERRRDRPRPRRPRRDLPRPCRDGRSGAACLDHCAARTPAAHQTGGRR